jgi:uncharacterized membrane protein HdeD (DUF308 family)
MATHTGTIRTIRRTTLTAHGVFTTLLGVAVLIWPGATLVLIAYLFACYLLVNGIVQIILAITDPDELSGGRRVVLGLLGALASLMAVLCLRAPLAVLALLIGAWWFVSGVLLIVAAMSVSADRERPWTATGGALAVLGGLLLLLQPDLTLFGLTLILGIWLVLHGALLIAADWQRH